MPDPSLPRPIAALAATLALLLMLLLPGPAFAEEVALADGWRFMKRDIAGAEQPGFDDSGWAAVAVPHSYNDEDSGIGGAKARGEPEGVYYRGPAWYRLRIDHRPRPGTRYALRFGGATLKASVWLNGQLLGRHEGGYAAFGFDATDALRPGANVLAVRVDNARDTGIAPLNGDFNIFGGLYRPVTLIATPDLHIDRLDHGGPGVAVRTLRLDAKEALIGVDTRIANDRAGPASLAIVTHILDARGRTVATLRTPATLAAGARDIVNQTIRLKAPTLWQGRKAPYLYRVVAELVAGDAAPIDSVAAQLGVRTVGIGMDGRFELNGRPYPLRGANLQHPTRFGRGPIVTDAEIDEDLQLMFDMGATGVRLAHMQHPPRVYARADEIGLLLLTEVPLIDDHDPSDRFRENLLQQMRELIAQTGNHPSVALWGIGNEIRKSDAASNRILAELQATAKALDPARPTTYAHCCLDDADPIAQHSDTVSYNRYFGWYWDKSEDIGPWADALHAKLPGRPIGISEYGAGASIRHQEDPVVKRPESNGYWHPEQYQTDFHEKHWREIAKRPFLWSSFVWVGIDFPSFKRNEGDRPAINDKGLVTEDRKTRKDAWYWYQANWSEAPMLHITSRRDTAKRTRAVKVRVFSNLPSLRLRLNGGPWTEVPVADHVATWPVELATGENLVEASGRAADGRELVDAVRWGFATAP